LTSQLHNEITAIAEAENTRHEAARLAAELRQAANAQHEGALGLVSAEYGATPPTMYGVEPSVRRQKENASALLALNPRSQNDQANPVRAQVPPPAPHDGDAGVTGGGVEALCGHVKAAHDVVAIRANPPIVQVAAADPPIVQVAAVDPPIVQVAAADPPIVQAAAGIPNTIQVQAVAALPPNIHVPVLPGIVSLANARAQAIANRCNLAAAAGNNCPPTVVDQEDVVNMHRPRNRNNVEIYNEMQCSILQATNALTRAMEGRAQPPPPPRPAPQPLPSITPPPPGQDLGEQINSLYKRLKMLVRRGWMRRLCATSARSLSSRREMRSEHTHYSSTTTRMKLRRLVGSSAHRVLVSSSACWTGSLACRLVGSSSAHQFGLLFLLLPD